MPVTARGSETVSPGSTITARASRCAERMLRFTPMLVTFTTAFFVTSAPVPAVVGTATQGVQGPGTGMEPSTPSRKRSTFPGKRTSAESAFAVAEAMGPTRSREVMDKLLAQSTSGANAEAVAKASDKDSVEGSADGQRSVCTVRSSRLWFRRSARGELPSQWLPVTRRTLLPKLPTMLRSVSKAPIPK